MLVTEVNEALPGGSSLLRNEPVQARSSARLTGLLDAAAAIIDEIGFERLTTAMVAERAGASIGTVYRYFPDRIAVVEALAVRSVQRLIERVDAAVIERGLTEWRDSIEIAIDTEVAMYRAEPGFRAIRFGDVENSDKVPSGKDDSAKQTADENRRSLAERFTALLVDRFGLVASSEFTFAIDVATELGSALIARAFARDPQGDPRFIEECRVVVAGYLDRAVVTRA
ncbi:TetR family transcriptional regulator [Frondihabitans sucicola]|uniref:TetR family transcriptional regulator n=1 Tax=Frondihabitans sucicola TaxID=1268041 RepID=A0ABM8GRM7_9MICO|nr:TetR/AcrR family transcriptional regulator [Frondihabitans sucicola]BDZ50954.1 TetR family transcriptional regulator [Frondihabitans sucicola]